MIVKIKTDPAYGKPEVQICTAVVTPEVEKMAKTIEDALGGSLYAYKDEEIVKVPYREIVRIFTQNKNVYLTTETEQFRIKERLYELEETHTSTVRISNLFPAGTWAKSNRRWDCRRCEYEKRTDKKNNRRFFLCRRHQCGGRAYLYPGFQGRTAGAFVFRLF